MDERTGVPTRTCVGCRQRAAKPELLRLVVARDGDGLPVVVPDPRGAASGRGAHLHPTPDCYRLAVRRRAFGRAFRLAGQPGSAAVGEYVGSDPNETT